MSSLLPSKPIRPYIFRFSFIIVFILLAGFGSASAAETIVIDGKTYSLDTLANFKVGPGSRYTSLRLQSNNRLDVYFLKVDTSNPYVTFRAALGRDSIYSGEQPSAVAKRKSKDGAVYFAGTNGDFYATTGYIGYPVGGCIVDYEIARPPSVDRKVMAFGNDKIPFIGTMTYQGFFTRGTDTMTVNTVNHLRNTNQLVLYNQHNGKTTRTNSFGTEVLVELASGQHWQVNDTIRLKVIKIEKEKGNMAIPKGAAVLSGHGTAATLLNKLAVDDELNLLLTIDHAGIRESYSQMIGGDNRRPMLNDGVVETTEVWNELHPRTALGYSKDKKTVLFCVVDGRGSSAGVTTKQLAELMKSAGAWTAYNIDGGGSSSMYVKDFGPMNVPSDGTERAVANSLFAVSSAPADAVISSIESYETTIQLPKFGVFKPRFLGYNQYGVLINKDLQDVVLSCDAATGYINQNGEFVFSGNTNGKLTATYGSISTTVNVVLASEAEIFIRLDSLIIDNNVGYPIEVQSKIGLNTMSVLPSALNWEVRDASICKIEDGILTGLKNGSTTIVGNLGTFSDSIRVTVEIPANARFEQEVFQPTDEWTLTSSSSSWNTHFAPDARPAHWQHGTAVQYTFSSTRSPFFKLTRSLPLFGLPDTVQLVINTGNASFSSVIIGMKAATAGTATPVTFNSVGGSSDIQLSVPRSAFMNNTNDIANFPASVEYITFYLNTNNHVAAQTYTIGFREIALRYNYITTFIDPVPDSNRFVVFPNPANGSMVTINGPFESGTVLRLTTIEGKTVYQNKVSGTTTSVPVENLAAGTYLIQLFSGESTETHRIILH